MAPTRGSLATALVTLAMGVPCRAEPSATPSHTGGESGPTKPAQIWPAFRGPGGAGVASATNPPLTWHLEDGARQRWKTQIPQPGMSSPVVSEGRVFLTGADETSRQIYCYAADTGKLLWRHAAGGIDGSPPLESLPMVLDETGFASPTPTSNGRFLAAIFGTGDLVCVNPDGKRIWAKNLGVPENHYGHATSLICDDQRLYVQYDQAENSKLFSFDMATGVLVWEVERNTISWSSPILVNHQGRRELILTDCEAVDSYDPKTGKPLWHVECLGGEVAPSAAYADGRVFVASDGIALSAIEIGDSGSTPEVRWAWDEILPDAASLVADNAVVIVPTAYGIVNCLNARTGEVHWEHEFDDGFYSSPILAGDRIYLADTDGTLHVFRMDKTFELLGKLSIDEPIYATPAFAGNQIFIRGLTHLFCFEFGD